MGCTASQIEEPYMRSKQPERSYSKVSKISFSDEYFTTTQKHILRNSWEYLDCAPVEKGTQIFLKIFASKPQTKKLFPFGNLDDKEMINNPLFRGHAVRFMHAVGSVVKNLDALDLICAPTLVRLGRKHAWIADFISEYLDVFRISIKEVFQQELGSKCTTELLDAWHEVFKFIASKMHEGYQEAIHDQNVRVNSVTYITELVDTNSYNQPTDRDIKLGDYILEKVEESCLENGNGRNETLFTEQISDQLSEEIMLEKLTKGLKESLESDIVSENTQDKYITTGIQHSNLNSQEDLLITDLAYSRVSIEENGYHINKDIDLPCTPENNTTRYLDSVYDGNRTTEPTSSLFSENKTVTPNMFQLNHT